MRVLWLSHNVPYPPIGGVLQRNYHLIREASQRAEVHLVALRQRALCVDDAALAKARDALESLCASVSVHPLDWDESRAARLRLAGQAVVGQAPWDELRFYSSAAHRWFRAAQAPEVDLVHIDTLGLVPYARYFAGLPVVVNHHNVESQMMGRRAEQSASPVKRAFFRLHARLLRRAEVESAQRFDHHLVVSELDGARLREHAPARHTTVVANGVDTTYFARETCDDPESRRAVFVGAHSWYPNRDAVVYFLRQIWPRVQALEPRAEFTTIGRNTCDEVLDAAASDPRIRPLGFVEDLRSEMARAAVFVMPFMQGGGTRLKLLDALAMGVPVVTTKMGAEGVPVADRQHCLIADEPEAFARAVVELVQDPELRERLARAGRELVEQQFDWSVIGARLNDAYAAALEGDGDVSDVAPAASDFEMRRSAEAGG